MTAFCDIPLDLNAKDDGGKPLPTWFYVGKRTLPAKRIGYEKHWLDVWALVEPDLRYKRLEFQLPLGARTRRDWLIAIAAILAEARGIGMTPTRAFYANCDPLILQLREGSFSPGAVAHKAPRSFAENMPNSTNPATKGSSL